VTFDTALRLGRVSNLPTVWTNVLAAAVLAGAPPAGIALPLTALACSLFYTGGMFLNDAFDREFDARVRPERPIPSGLVSATQVFAAGFAQLAAGVLLIALVARHTVGTTGGAVTAGLALAALIVLYDVWHKQNPFGPLVMGLCRVLVYLTTVVTLTGAVPWAVLGGAGVLLAYLMGLTYVARQENLAEVRQRWPVALLAAPFVVGVPLLFAGGVATLLYLGFLGWVVFSVSHLGWRARLDVPRAVVSLIAGVSLLDAVLIAGHGSTSLVPVAVLGFLLTLVLQRWVAGT
jgi:4-hydroxybenzoate polyprenyltransferase